MPTSEIHRNNTAIDACKIDGRSAFFLEVVKNDMDVSKRECRYEYVKIVESCLPRFFHEVEEVRFIEGWVWPVEGA